MSHSSPHTGTQRYLPFVIGTIAASVVGAFVIGGWWLSQRMARPSSIADGPFTVPGLNYAFEFPRGWAVNETPGRAWDAVLLMKRAAPEVTTVLAAKDDKTRLWSDFELNAELLRRLNALFSALAHDPPKAAKLAARPATKLVFQGERDDVLCSGEAIAQQHQGFSYYLISWCRADAAVEGEPAMREIQNGFSLLNGRPDWAPVVRTFVGTRFAYSLTDDAERWQPSRSAANTFDPNADLALEAMEPGATSADKRATLVVTHLPVSGRPMDAVIARIIEREKATFPEIEVEPVATESVPEGAELLMQSFRVNCGPGRTRFVLVGVSTHANGLVVFEAECDWPRKFFWQPEFYRMLLTYRLRPAG